MSKVYGVNEYSGVIAFPVTIANCTNIATPVDILSFTIPANVASYGDKLVLTLVYDMRQNSGVAVNLTSQININGTSLHNITGSVTNAASVRSIIAKQEFIIVNHATHDCAGIFGSTITSYIQGSTGFSLGNTGAGGGRGNTYNINLTIDNIITVRGQWAVANANSYIITRAAHAYIIKGGR